MGREEAQMEYLKIVQDLDMYGINYFQIRVSLRLVYYLLFYESNSTYCCVPGCPCTFILFVKDSLSFVYHDRANYQ